MNKPNTTVWVNQQKKAIYGNSSGEKNDIDLLWMKTEQKKKYNKALTAVSSENEKNNVQNQTPLFLQTLLYTFMSIRKLNRTWKHVTMYTL